MQPTPRRPTSPAPSAEAAPAPAWHGAAALGPLLLLAAALRIPGLRDSLWYDEVSASRVHLGSLAHYFERMLTLSHMPTHYTLMYFWIQLFGDSEISVRTPPFLFGMGSIALAYAIVERIADRRTALLTAFLLAVSPVAIWFSTEARPYSGACFFLLLAVLSSLRLEDSKASVRWSLVYFVSLLAAVYSQMYMVVFPALLLAVACLRIRRTGLHVILMTAAVLLLFGLLIMVKHAFFPRALLLLLPAILLLLPLRFVRVDPVRLRLVVVSALALAAVVLFVRLQDVFTYVGTGVTGAGYLRAFGPYEAWMLFFNWYLTGNALWFSPEPASLRGSPHVLACQLLALALLLRGITAFLRDARQRRAPGGALIALLLFGIPAFLVLLGWIGYEETYVERSAFAALPFYFATLARGATSIRLPRRRNGVVGALVVFQLVTVGSFYAQRDRWTVYKPKPDWRAATRHLGDEIDRYGTGSLVLTATPALPLSYYDPRLVYTGRIPAMERQIRLYIDRLERALGSGSRVAAALRRNVVFPPSATRAVTTGAAVPIRRGLAPLDALDPSTRRIYFVQNLYWRGESDAMLRRLLLRGAEQSLALLDTREFKGLRVYTFERAAP